jgi:hypothetical protein
MTLSGRGEALVWNLDRGCLDGAEGSGNGKMGIEWEEIAVAITHWMCLASTPRASARWSSSWELRNHLTDVGRDPRYNGLGTKVSGTWGHA